MDDSYDPFSGDYVRVSSIDELTTMRLHYDDFENAKNQKPKVSGVDYMNCLFDIIDFRSLGESKLHTIRLPDNSLYRYWIFINNASGYKKNPKTLFFFPDSIDQLQKKVKFGTNFILKEVQRRNYKTSERSDIPLDIPVKTQLQLMPGLINPSAFPECMFGTSALPFALSLADLGWNVVLMSPHDPVEISMSYVLPQIILYHKKDLKGGSSKRFFLSVENRNEGCLYNFLDSSPGALFSGGFVWSFDNSRQDATNLFNVHLIPFTQLSGEDNTKSYQRLFDTTTVFLDILASQKSFSKC